MGLSNNKHEEKIDYYINKNYKYTRFLQFIIVKVANDFVSNCVFSIRFISKKNYNTFKQAVLVYIYSS